MVEKIMLHYLIKIIDVAFPATVVFALLLPVIIRLCKGRVNLIISWGAIVGASASLIYAVLKRNTGFAVREFYDLGVILVSVPVFLIICVLVWQAGRFYAANLKTKDL